MGDAEKGATANGGGNAGGEAAGARDSGVHSRLVPVRYAATSTMAAIWLSLLQDAGIPAVAQGEKLSILQGYLPSTPFTQRVCVPFEYVEQARAVLASRQEQPEAGAAGGPGTTAAWPPQDPLLDQMAALGQLPPEVRDARLAEVVAYWRAEGRPIAGIAPYLFAAGLSLDAALGLIEAVDRERTAPLEKARAWRFSVGLVVLVAGAAWLYVSLRLMRFEFFPLDFGGIVVMAIGVGVMYSALSVKTPPAADHSGEPEEAGDSAHWP